MPAFGCVLRHTSTGTSLLRRPTPEFVKDRRMRTVLTLIYSILILQEPDNKKTSINFSVFHFLEFHLVKCCAFLI